MTNKGLTVAVHQGLHMTKKKKKKATSRPAETLWRGIQAFTNFRTTPPACDSNISLPEAVNDLYTQFEVEKGMTARNITAHPNDQMLCLTTADVRKTQCRTHGSG